MIKQACKNVKSVVDGISTVQKLIGFLMILLGASLAGNLYQHGLVMGATELTACVAEPVPVFIDRVIKEKTHEVIIREVCPKHSHPAPSNPIQKHEEEWHS